MIKINDKVREKFIRYIKKNGLRITNERILVLETVFKMESHFNADELYKKMRKEHIRVSRATVYNTLELMNECNILTKHNFRSERARYETKKNAKPHYHILCVKCNSIFEFSDRVILERLFNICKSRKITMIDHSIQVFGVCENKNRCEYDRSYNIALK